MHRIIEPIIAAILTIALLETTLELLGRPVAWAVGVAIFTLIAVVLWRRS